MKFPPNGVILPLEYIAIRAQVLAKDPLKAQREIESLIYDRKRFSCFSIAHEKNLFGNNMFWASYANKHNGLCLKFNGEKLLNHYWHNRHIAPISINYTKSNQIPEFNYVRNKLEGNKSALQYFFGTKSKEWENEDELRLIYSSKKKIESNFLEFEFEPTCLEEVYLGYKFCLDKVIEIKKILSDVKYEHVKLYRLERDNLLFKFIPIEVDIS